MLFDMKNWHGVIFWLEKALKIQNRSNSYINEPSSWGALPYDLISLACYYVKDYENAVKYVNEAIKLSGEARLSDNKRFFEEAEAKEKTKT